MYVYIYTYIAVYPAMRKTQITTEWYLRCAGALVEYAPQQG